MRWSPRKSPALALGLVIASSAPLSAEQSGFLGKPANHWTDDLKPAQPVPVRRSAAFALGKMGGQAFDRLPRLVEALNDPDASVRDAAAYAIGEICASLGPDAASQWDLTGPALLNALAKDTDGHVRRSAAFALGSQGRNAASAEKALRTALRDPDPIVRQQAARALGRLVEVEPEAVQALCGSLADADALVRRDAAQALGQLGQPAALPAIRPLLARFMEEKDANARRAALDALVSLVGPDERADKALVRELLKALRTDDDDVRRAAALGLGNIGGPDAAQAVGPLCELLRQDDPLFQSQAAAALANIGPQAALAVPALTDALSASDAATRRNAAFALSAIGPRALPAVAKLVALLDSKQPDDVRRYAAEAIHKIGPEAMEAIPALKRALKEDKSKEVRVKAVMALGNHEFTARGVREALEETLPETRDDMAVVRYNAAVVLTDHLKENVSVKTIDVLQAALFDRDLSVYAGSSARVKGTGGEAATGDSRVSEANNGDGREVIALALAEIGRRANRPKIIEGLEDTARSPNEGAREAAKKALKAVKGN